MQKGHYIHEENIYTRAHGSQNTAYEIQNTAYEGQNTTYTGRYSYRDIKGIIHKCKGARRKDECARGGHERKNRMYQEKVQYERKPAIWTRVKAYDSKN